MQAELSECAQASATASEFEAQVLGLLDRQIGCDVAYFTTRGQEASPTVLRLERAVVETAIRRGPKYEVRLVPVTTTNEEYSRDAIRNVVVVARRDG